MPVTQPMDNDVDETQHNAPRFDWGGGPGYVKLSTMLGFPYSCLRDWRIPIRHYCLGHTYPTPAFNGRRETLSHPSPQ